MSQTIISVERVNEVKPHPNADRLDVIQVLGYQVVTGKDNFKVGDLVAYFPPDILLPPAQAKALGVAGYLKHAIFPGDAAKTTCRVGAARLRGVPSHGFCAPAGHHAMFESSLAVGSEITVTEMEIGTDVTDLYGAHKYVAPVRVGAGDAAADLPAFHKYTSIENIQRYSAAFTEGQPVVITEKIHGTNCRLGLVRDNSGEFTFCAGSHKVRRKEGSGLYWEFMDENMMNMLSFLSDADDCTGPPCHDVVVFGEIFGPGIQDMQYGRTGHDFRVFDISIDGQYMSYWDMVTTCDAHGLLTVPLLSAGDFSLELVDAHTYGPSTFDGITAKFKDREGCVIRPTIEAHSDILGGRLLLKSVSADYLDRKGATDVGE